MHSENHIHLQSRSFLRSGPTKLYFPYDNFWIRLSTNCFSSRSLLGLEEEEEEGLAATKPSAVPMIPDAAGQRNIVYKLNTQEHT